MILGGVTAFLWRGVADFLDVPRFVCVFFCCFLIPGGCPISQPFQVSFVFDHPLIHPEFPPAAGDYRKHLSCNPLLQAGGRMKMVSENDYSCVALLLSWFVFMNQLSASWAIFGGTE